jgi:hypothetical protein
MFSRFVSSFLCLYFVCILFFLLMYWMTAALTSCRPHPRDASLLSRSHDIHITSLFGFSNHVGHDMHSTSLFEFIPPPPPLTRLPRQLLGTATPTIILSFLLLFWVDALFSFARICSCFFFCSRSLLVHMKVWCRGYRQITVLPQV